MKRALVLAVALLALPAAASEHPLDLVAPVDGPIARHFEPPPTPFAAGHRGIDFATLEGADVVAAAAGVVAFAGQVGGDLFVSIDHADGYRTTYSFLGEVLTARGTTVAQGELIARAGTAHHGHHFGLRRDGDYLDPEPVLLASIRANLWRVVGLVASPGS